MGPAEGVRSGGDEHSWTPISCRCLSRNDCQPSAAQYQRAGFAVAGEVKCSPEFPLCTSVSSVVQAFSTTEGTEDDLCPVIRNALFAGTRHANCIAND